MKNENDDDNNNNYFIVICIFFCQINIYLSTKKKENIT